MVDRDSAVSDYRPSIGPLEKKSDPAIAKTVSRGRDEVAAGSSKSACAKTKASLTEKVGDEFEEIYRAGAT